MRTTQSALSTAFGDLYTREVAASLTITRHLPCDPDTSSFEDLIRFFNSHSGIVVQRAWYGFDRIIFDADLKNKVGVLIDDEAEAEKIYEQLQINPSAALTRLREEFDVIKDVREALEEPVVPFIRLDLNDKEPVSAIRMTVPFERLQKFLLRAVRLLETHGIGVLNEVKISSSPRFDNADAAVADLMSPTT